MKPKRVGLVQRRAVDAVAEARVLGEEIAALAPLSVRSHKHALNAVAAAARSITTCGVGWRSSRRRPSRARISRKGSRRSANGEPQRFRGR